MEKMLENLFDTYGRKARLYPAFLALAPLFAVATAYTNWFEFKLTHMVWTVVGAAALFLLADVTRQLGKAVEAKLVKNWKAFPSVTLLRHRDTTLDPYTTASYHRAAEKLLSSITMPSVQDEENDPDDADNRYRAVTNLILPRTRDLKRFNLLFKENVNYGFRRNMLGLKPIAFVVLAIASGICVYKGWSQISAFQLPEDRELSLIVAGLFAAFAWTFGVTKAATQAAASDYGRQLLMSLDHLSDE